MITVNQNGSQNQIITVSLNKTYVVDGDSVTVLFFSPSRIDISLVKTLTSIGSGFFTFELTLAERALFIDDTYSYHIKIGDYVLNTGFVRLIDNVVFGFDYLIESLLA